MKKKENIFWGILLLLIAAFILASGLGYFKETSAIKIVFAGISVGLSIKGILNINFYLIFFPLALIGIIFNNELNIDSLSPSILLLIALLFSIGLSLIFKKPNKYFHHINTKERIKDKIFIENDDSSINCSVTFGSTVKYVNTNDFKNMKIDCSFGSVKVFFDNATITSDSAVINLDIAFGGAELYIPKNWKIIQQCDSTFGGVTEKNTKCLESGPTVFLKGDVTFSGLTIIYV